jgi:TPR repeat protein
MGVIMFKKFFPIPLLFIGCVSLSEWQKECDEGKNGARCMDLAYNLAEYQKKPRAAISYYRKACEYGYTGACVAIYHDDNTDPQALADLKKKICSIPSSELSKQQFGHFQPNKNSSEGIEKFDTENVLARKAIVEKICNSNM